MKMGLVNVALQLGPSWATFFVFIVGIPEILSKKKYIDRGVIRSNMNLFLTKYKKMLNF